jgi:hypothetical protein
MDLISIFVEILLICVIGGLFYWAIGALGIPDPIGRIARVAVIILCSLALIYMLFGQIGGGHIGHSHAIVSVR